MQDNDFIRISYSGKVKESGQVLDSVEDVPVIVGAGYLIKGVDKFLKEMNVKEKKTVEINPDDGFGARDPKLIKLVPISEFRKHGTKPVPGMVIDADRLRGRVLSVSGGRVRVDFNHPLAGKVLIYEIEIKSKIEKPEDKVKAIIEFYGRIKTDQVEVKIKDKEADIVVPPLINSVYKKRISSDIFKFLGLEKVKFSEVFEKTKEEPKKE